MQHIYWNVLVHQPVCAAGLLDDNMSEQLLGSWHMQHQYGNVFVQLELDWFRLRNPVWGEQPGLLPRKRMQLGLRMQRLAGVHAAGDL